MNSGIRPSFVTPTPLLWFPQFETVAFRIHGPAEAAGKIVRYFAVYLNSGLAKLLEHPVEVLHAVIDHERCLARLEILGVSGKERPNGDPNGFWTVHLAPLEHWGLAGSGALTQLDTQMLLIPLGQLARVISLEEDAAKPRDAATLAAG